MRCKRRALEAAGLIDVEPPPPDLLNDYLENMRRKKRKNKHRKSNGKVKTSTRLKLIEENDDD